MWSTRASHISIAPDQLHVSGLSLSCHRPGPQLLVAAGLDRLMMEAGRYRATARNAGGTVANAPTAVRMSASRSGMRCSTLDGRRD